MKIEELTERLNEIASVEGNLEVRIGVTFGDGTEATYPVKSVMPTTLGSFSQELLGKKLVIIF